MKKKQKPNNRQQGRRLVTELLGRNRTELPEDGLIPGFEWEVQL